MIKLSEIPYSDFVDLTEYLYSLENGDKLFIERIARFFPNIKSALFIELTSICESIHEKNESAQTMYELFSDAHRDIEFDETGKSGISFSNPWEVILTALDKTFEIAEHNLSTNSRDKSKNKIDSQIYNAKTLKCLENIINKDYNCTKILFLKNSSNSGLVSKYLNEAEEVLKKNNCSNLVLGKLLLYIDKLPEARVNMFTKCFFERIHCLGLDNELSNKSNIEFLENIKKIK